MNEQIFWSLITSPTKNVWSEVTDWMKVCVQRLSEKDVVHIFKFDKILDWQLSKSNSVELWAASCVLSDEDSKEAFTNFRYWLMMQGQRVFKKAMDDPEILEIYAADFRVNAINLAAYQEMQYIAQRAYHRKTGLNDYNQIYPHQKEALKTVTTKDENNDIREISELLPVLCNKMGWDNEVPKGQWQSDS